MVFNNLVHNYYTIIKHVQIVYRVSASQATRPQRSVGYSNEFLAFIYVHIWAQTSTMENAHMTRGVPSRQS